MRNCTIRVAKTKALISFAELICAFVFAYADCWFSHGAVQIRITISRNVGDRMLQNVLKIKNNNNRKQNLRSLQNCPAFSQNK